MAFRKSIHFVGRMVRVLLLLKMIFRILKPRYIAAAVFPAVNIFSCAGIAYIARSVYCGINPVAGIYFRIARA